MNDIIEFDSPAHARRDAHLPGSQAVKPNNDGAHPTTEAQSRNSPVIAQIVQMWRLRQRWHRAEKSLILQGKALCRAFTYGDKDAANKLFEQALAGEADDPTVQMALVPFLAAISDFEPKRKAFEKQLTKLAQSLPIFPWVAEIKGFGALNLAALVGEAGDIGSYRNPSCLWKRMGMAVVDGGRQRKCADKDLAKIHGYNPRRRSVAWNIGGCLIKKVNRYRIVYDDRKTYVSTREGWTKAHAHNDAMRIMTKRVLRDLWRAWRDEVEANVSVPEGAMSALPTPHPIETEAIRRLQIAVTIMPRSQPSEPKAIAPLPNQAISSMPPARPTEAAA